MSPPNRVEPGFIHRKLAALILKAVQERANLSVGELPMPVADGGTGEAEDGREPVELLARIIAHIFHRIPGVKKVEKRLEGTDARSGLASDFAALVSQLASRNEEVVVGVGEQVVKDIIKKKPSANKPEAPIPSHWGGSEER